MPPEIVTSKRGFPAFFLHATDDAGTDVHQFDEPYTLEVGYTSEQLQALGIGEGDLTMAWFDQAAGENSQGAWVPIPTTVDPTTHIATATLDHFSAYALSDGSSPSDAYLPSLQGWQTNLGSGAASYSRHIDVPAGPGGLTPSLTLSYSSAATDGASGLRPKQQAGWVGKGWSLDTGAVALNRITLSSTTNSFINTYSLSFNGQSFDLVRGEPISGSSGVVTDPTQWVWHPTDETFLKVEVSYSSDSVARTQPAGIVDHASSDLSYGRGGWRNGTVLPRYTWRIWTKDGTRYEFKEDVWWGFNNCATNADFTLEANRWMLSSVTDVHGNSMTYSYWRQTYSQAYLTCGSRSVQGTIDRNVWPSSISWGANTATGVIDRYKVDFESTARGNDTAFDVADNQLGGTNGVPRETRQLNAVSVWSKQSTTWELVRKYSFVYDYSLLSDQTINSNQSQPAYPKLTLKSIQRVGKDNSSALPAMTFSYTTTRGTGTFGDGSWNRITGVNNGQGGTLGFSYETIATAMNGAAGYGLFANNRRVTSRTTTDGQGGSATWTYQYGTAAYNSLGTTLAGANSGPLADPTSAVLYYNEYASPTTDYSAWLAHRALKEFRGHDFVREIAPDGTQTEHWFFLGTASCGYPGKGGTPVTGETQIRTNACFQELVKAEVLKGKEYKTWVRSSAGSGAALLAETVHTFTVLGPSGAATIDYGADPFTGLWRSFSYESQTDETSYEGGTSGATKTTSFSYDLTPAENTNSDGGVYGNLTRLDEFANGSRIRITKYMYATTRPAGSWLVDRRWARVTWDGSWQLLSYRALLYDGSTTAGVTSGRGLLTSERVFSDVPLTTPSGTLIHSSDTSFSYDAYGNRLSSTTYAGPGSATLTGSTWSFSAAGGGSAGTTSVTTYDSTFHLFPIQVDQPTGSLTLTEKAGYDYRMGTLTSVSDPNDTATNDTTVFAEYDVHGRMVKLIKPGDTSALPTVQATYYDTAIPFRYRVDQREVAGNSSLYRPTTTIYDGLGRLMQTKTESVNLAQNIVSDTLYDGLNRPVKQSQPRYVAETPSTTFWTFTPRAADSVMRWTSTSYDALGRPNVVTAPDGTTTTNYYSISNGRLRTGTVDASGHATATETDVLGRLSLVQEYTGTSTYVLDGTTTYSYTPLDLLSSVTDAAGNVTTMTYDSAGRKLTMHDPDMGTWSYTYDPVGTLKTQTDGRGNIITFTYDRINRLTAKSFSTGGSATYGYDAGTNGKGQRTSMSNAAGSTSWEYDTRGRLKQQNDTPAGQATYGTAWVYDSADRLTTTTYYNGELVDISYDPAWRPTHLCSRNVICYTYDASYTALSQPLSMGFGNNFAQSRSYTSPMQQLNRLQVSNGSVFVYDRTYTYDGVGNVSTLKDNLIPAGQSQTQTQNFSYDHRDRLVQAWTTGHTVNSYNETMSYNSIGNLLNKGSLWFTYPASGATSVRPHAVSNVGGLNYTYDGNGNLLSGGGRSYIWNPENQPTQITAPGSVTESYAYDADGARIKRTANGATTYYVAGGLVEVDPSTSTTRLLYQFNGQVVAQRTMTSSTNTVLYLHSDHLGSAVMTSTSAGATSTQEYTPWGAVRGGNLPSTTIDYTGQKKDTTGLLFYTARYYDPVLARFVSPDTIVPGTEAGNGGAAAATVGSGSTSSLTVDFHEGGFVSQLNGVNAQRQGQGFWFELSGQQQEDAEGPSGPANPQALNRYSYGLNNPVKYTDPTGHKQAGCGGESYCGGPGTSGPGGGSCCSWFAKILKALGLPVQAACSDGDCSNEVSFGISKLQHEFKHAADFGIKGNWNKVNAGAFERALSNFIRSAGTQMKTGYYRGTTQVIHFYDTATNLWVAVDLQGNFVAAWKLSADQLKYLLTTGNVQ